MEHESPEHHRHPDCVEVLQQLYVFLDGELNGERRATVSLHLQRCRPCLEAFEFEAELKAIISVRCRDEVPEQVQRRIATALHAAALEAAADQARAAGRPPPWHRRSR